MVQKRFDHPAHLPRHAFSARDCARAGDIWRAFQELAVLASTANGWPPSRYREEETAFVMRSMIVVHQAEAHYGGEFVGTTWVRRMRRGMLSTREVRLSVAGANAIALGTQEWVHVDANMKPSRGPASLVDAFPVLDEGLGEVQMPECEALEGPSFDFDFDVWFTWMDPLDHVNHPHYVDFAAEALAQRLHAHGLAPLGVRPVAEKVTFYRGLEARQQARVESALIGCSKAGVTHTRHLIRRRADDELCAEVVLARSHEDPEALKGSLLTG